MHDLSFRVWNVHTGEMLNTLIHHCEAVLHLRFQEGMMVTCSKVFTNCLYTILLCTDCLYTILLCTDCLYTNYVLTVCTQYYSLCTDCLYTILQSMHQLSVHNITTVESPLTATSLQRPGFFVPTVHQYIHFTLIETSLQRPPLYNGQLFRPQGGRCREVQLYVPTVCTHPGLKGRRE